MQSRCEIVVKLINELSLFELAYLCKSYIMMMTLVVVVMVMMM